jgi:ABC-2 type transport system ATP-binding protein
MSSDHGPAASSAKVLQGRGVGHDYDELVAVESLDVEISAGELVALVGPNGAGKSTLLAIAAGLLEPSHGVMLIRGFTAGSIEARAATSYIPDTPVLYEDLSLDEHLEYVARLHGADDWPSRGASLLQRLGLEEWGENLPSQFSHGMRQKASIAVGLIRPFTVLLADEPFDGLDPPSRTALVALLKEVTADGGSVIVSTHRTEILDFADRCLVLYDGELTYDGPPDPSVLMDFGTAGN